MSNLAVLQSPPLDYEGVHLKRSIRTVSRRKGEWLANVKINSKHIHKDVRDLWIDRDYPEVINVAAGPSLANDMEDLKKLRVGRELIVVDAAFKFCLENQVIPDFVVSTDASEKILSMFDGIDLRKLPTKLILNVIAHPKVAETWRGDIYWFVMNNQFYDADEHEMIQMMHSIHSGIGQAYLVPGGNVSSISLGLALTYRRATKLYLFGHDFCWKKDMYCGGYFQDLAAERLSDEGKSGTVFETMNARGEKVWTNLSLRNFAAWHQEVINRVKERVVNCTSSTILS